MDVQILNVILCAYSTWSFILLSIQPIMILQHNTLHCADTGQELWYEQLLCSCQTSEWMQGKKYDHSYSDTVSFEYRLSDNWTAEDWKNNRLFFQSSAI